MSYQPLKMKVLCSFKAMKYVNYLVHNITSQKTEVLKINTVETTICTCSLLLLIL